MGTTIYTSCPTLSKMNPCSFILVSFANKTLHRLVAVTSTGFGKAQSVPKLLDEFKVKGARKVHPTST